MSKLDKFINNLPKELTEDEKELQSKYETLRRLKLKLQSFQKENNDEDIVIQDSFHHHITTSQANLKRAAAQILKGRGGLIKKDRGRNKTKEFKRALKQNGDDQAGQKRITMEEYTDSQPRSVAIRGQNLTHKLLLGSFGKFGDIWKVKMDPNNQSAVITFKLSNSAQSAAIAMHGCLLEGKQISVELVKRRNDSWLDIAKAEEKLSKHDHKRSEKRTVHVAYKGNLSAPDFRNIFRSMGKIEKIYISSLNSKRPSQNQYAFVTFQYEDEAHRAVKTVNGVEFKGIHLSVSPQRIIQHDFSLNSNPTQERDSRELITYD